MSDSQLPANQPEKQPEKTKLPAEQSRDVFETYIDRAAAVSPDSVICESRCKLCNHALRAEAEQYWDAKRQNASAVVRFLADRGLAIDDKSVSSHMWKHYEEQKRRLDTLEYARKIKAYESVRTDRLKSLKTYRDILAHELLELGRHNDKLDPFERRKNVELQQKLVDQLAKLDEMEKKFLEEWSPARVVLQRLSDLIVLELQNNVSQETKLAFDRVVTALVQEVPTIENSEKGG